MIKKRNKASVYIAAVCIVVIICILGSGLIVCYYENATLNNTIRKLTDEKERLREENQQYQRELVRLNGEMDSIKVKADQYDAQVEAEKKSENLKQLQDLPAGTVLDRNTIEEYLEELFYAKEICLNDEVYNRIIGKSYRENDNIKLEDLNYIKVLHYNFEHQIQIGEMIVNRDICDDALNIFRELFQIEYEIYSMHLIDDYWQGDGGASDTASIEANNTTCFCYREVTGGSNLSNHAYGRAIDINPQQNPYVWYEGQELRWSHDNASPYIDRNCGDPHVIVNGDSCYSIFAKYGFSWGGNWNNPIDYQHFEKVL